MWRLKNIFLFNNDGCFRNFDYICIRDEEKIRMMEKIIVCCLLFFLNVAAQGQETIDSVSAPKSKSFFMERLHQVQQYLDTKARAKVDLDYIEVPEKPWRVILRYKENAVDVDYSQSVDKNAGRYYSFSSTGAKYGFNFRLRRFNTQDAKFNSTEHDLTTGVESQTDTAFSMPAPVWIRSVYINGYYVFNGRRYSQAAAYNQSVIQRRSAGSLLVGATWYQSSFDYADI